MTPFVWGANGAQLTPEQIARQRQVADALMAQGADYSPVGSWTQGAARVANALAGALKERRANTAEQAGQKSAAEQMASLLSGGAPSAPIADATAAPVAAPALDPDVVNPASMPVGSPTYRPGDVTSPQGDHPGQAFQYFTKAGWSPQAAAGIVGGLTQESGFRPDVLAGETMGDSGSAGYVAQWRGDRLNAFKQFAASQRLNPADPKTQYAFVDQELNGSESAAGQALRQAKSVTDAAAAFNGYERPQGWSAGGDPSAVNGWQNRLGAANDAFAKYGAPTGMEPPVAATAVPGGGATAAPAASAAPGLQQLLTVAQNPFLSDGQRTVVGALLKQALDKAPKNWQKLDDNTLFDATSGETRSVGAPGAPGSSMFKGNSVEAQALNGLVSTNAITSDQALQLGAGKTITGPNGELIFMTPQGIFSRPSPSVAPAAPGEPAATPQPDQSGMIPLTAPRVTDAQKNAMTYADRMKQSGSILDQMGDAGTGLGDELKSMVPFVGNSLVSDDYQKVDQAQRDFINAQLRRESGAAISNSEFDNAKKQYFPQRGDSPELIQQKAANRRTVIDGMIRDAGPGYAPRKDDTPSPAPKVRRYNPQTGTLE